jgi:DNA primase
MLIKLSLNDSIKSFNEEDLKNEMLFFLRKYYTQELKKIRNFNDIPFDKKAFLIRQFTEKVNRLKRGELVPFSS